MTNRTNMETNAAQERKQKLGWLVSIAISAVLAGVLSNLLEKHLPSFGQFWQMVIFIPLWCLFVEFVVWLFVPNFLKDKKEWCKQFLSTLCLQYVVFLFLVGLFLLIGDPVTKASRMFLVVQFIQLPTSVYTRKKEMREEELNAMRKNDDLYTRAMRQLRRDETTETKE